MYILIPSDDFTKGQIQSISRSKVTGVKVKGHGVKVKSNRGRGQRSQGQSERSQGLGSNFGEDLYTYTWKTKVWDI